MKKQIFWLYITVFINILGFGMVVPLIPYFAEHFGASFLEIGFIAATFSLGQLLTAPFWGRLSDRYGRKPILIISLLGSVVSYLVLAVATNLEMIFLARLFKGMASAAAFPIAQAYIADITTKEERTVYIGRLSAMYALGFIFGPVFGGLLGNFGFSTAFFVASAVTFANLVLLMIFVKESITQKAEEFVLREGFLNFKAIYQGLRSDFGVLFFLLFAWSFYISNFQVAIPLFTEHKFGMGPLENGIFFSVIGLVASANQWFVLPIVVKKFGEINVILWSLVLMIIGQILSPLAWVALMFYIFFTISTIGSGLVRPTVNAVLSKKTYEGQGTTMGLAFSFEGLGRMIGPLIAGATIQKFGLGFPFWLASGVLTLGLFLFWKVELKRS